MLGVDEERALLADLPVPPADRWLQLLYQCALFLLPASERSAVIPCHAFAAMPLSHLACDKWTCTACVCWHPVNC